MSNQSHKEKLLHIATIGKTVGIKGDMKFHLKTDFPEQFVVGAEFLSDKKDKIILDYVDLDRGLVRINALNNPEDAKKWVNAKLFATYEQTRESCTLGEDEYFFFDLEDCKVYEDGELLGVVYEVDRIANTNYLSILTDKKLIEAGYAKKFLIPFVKPFKQSVDIDTKTILVASGKDILKAS